MKWINFIFAICLLLILIANYLKIVENGIFIGLITGSLTFYIGMFQQRLNDDKIFKDLFQSFNSRYDTYNDLINTCSRDSSKSLSDKEENLIIDYLNMCAEEYLWYKRDRIPSQVWRSWRKGILSNIDIPQIHEIYMRERRQKDSYYGLFEDLERK